MKLPLATLAPLAGLALAAAAFSPRGAPQETGIVGLGVAPGVEATLFAEAPMVASPTAMEVDPRGRLWVTEAREAAEPARGAADSTLTPDPGDRIVILEDVDGDGRADSAKTFYQGPDVNGATGIALLGNRLIVSAGESVFLFTDSDGDDRPDEKRVIFRRDPSRGEPTTRSFFVGPDGRLYFNTGSAGGALRDGQGKVIVDRAGKRIVPDSGTYRQGMVLRVNEDFSDVEVIGHNFHAPGELALDSYGTVWQSDDDDDDRSAAARLNYVMEYGDFGYRDQVTGTSWRTARAGLEREIPLQHWHQNDPGVIPNVAVTGSGTPAGLTVYEGALLPAPFRDAVIHADEGRKLVRAYRPFPVGAGYGARMVTLLQATTDRTFRPVDVAPAPDGSLFVADRHDPRPGATPEEGVGRGRIIRLAPPGARYAVPPLDVSTSRAAVHALRSPSAATRYVAQAALARLGAPGDAALWELWADADPRMRARALWVLAQRGTRGSRYIDEAVRDPNPDIRITGLRAARLVNRNVLTHARRLVNDSSVQVRREVALAIRTDARPAARQFWVQLARQYDGKDRWYLEALGIAADGRWMNFFTEWRRVMRREWDEEAGRDLVWRARDGELLPTLTAMLDDRTLAPDERQRLLRALDFHRGVDRERALLDVLEDPEIDLRTAAVALLALDSARIRMTAPLARALDRTLNGSRDSRYFVDLARRFGSRGYAVALSQIALDKADTPTGVDAARLVIGWLGMAPFRQAATGRDTAAARRALTVLAQVGTPEARSIIEEVALSPERPQPVRESAVRAFARIAVPAVAELGAGRSVGDRRLLQLVESGALPVELHEAAAAVLYDSPRPDVRAAVSRLLRAPPRRASDGTPLPPVSELASRTGDATLGSSVFERACTSCHQPGGGLGPPLGGVASRMSRSDLYRAILEPDAGIAFGYEGYRLRLKNGIELVGVLVDETPTVVMLRTADGSTDRYPRADIALMVQMESSLMPARLETTLTEPELVALVEYLASLRDPSP